MIDVTNGITTNGSRATDGRVGMAEGSFHGRFARTIVAAIDGDVWGGMALRAVKSLAAHGSCDVVTLPVIATASVIARTAERYESAIIVIPAPAAGDPERTAMARLSAAIAAATRHAVLAVPPDVTWPPRVCVAGIDFGRASIAAATVAGELLEVPGQEVFVTIEPDLSRGPRKGVETIRRHLTLLFDAIPQTIPMRSGISRTFELRSGAPAVVLLERIAAYRGDLLAIGLDGAAGSPWRLPIPPGPTVRGMLGTAPCAVLLASGH